MALAIVLKARPLPRRSETLSASSILSRTPRACWLSSRRARWPYRFPHCAPPASIRSRRSDRTERSHESARSVTAHSRAGDAAPRRTRARRGARVPHRARDAEAHRRRPEPRRRSRAGAGALRPGAAAADQCRDARAPVSSTTWYATSSTRSARSAARRSPRSPSSRRSHSASDSSRWCSRSTTSSFFASMPCGTPASCLPWSGLDRPRRG